MEIRKADAGDLERFVKFLYTVRDAMEEKDWFFLDDPEVFRGLMERGIMEIWLAMDGDRIAGALDVLIPGTEEINYGYDLNFSEEMLLQSANMDCAAVDPAYRGLGLQRQLLEEAERWLRGRGIRNLLCTIHPENRFSLNNALKQGYSVQKRLEMYGSVRYILLRLI